MLAFHSVLKPEILAGFAEVLNPGWLRGGVVGCLKGRKIVRTFFADAPLATEQVVPFITSVPGVVADVVAFFS